MCAAVQLIAPGNSPNTEADFSSLAKTIRYLQATKTRGLTYVPLDLRTVPIIILTDASFANATRLRSQLGYVILILDAKQRANIVHYGSSRCKGVVRSVLAAEVHGLLLGFDFGLLVKDLLEEILGRTLLMEAMVDSWTLFSVIAKDAPTTERRLQIDVAALRESYAKGELHRIGWIPGLANPADALTKQVLKDNSPLSLLVQQNHFMVELTGWAERSPRSPPYSDENHSDQPVDGVQDSDSSPDGHETTRRTTRRTADGR